MEFDWLFIGQSQYNTWTICAQQKCEGIKKLYAKYTSHELIRNTEVYKSNTKYSTEGKFSEPAIKYGQLNYA